MAVSVIPTNILNIKYKILNRFNLCSIHNDSPKFDF